MSQAALRILFAVNGLAAGGAEIFMLRKIRQLRQRGHYAALAYCTKRGEQIDSYLEEYLQNRDIYQVGHDFVSIQPLIKQLRAQIFHTIQAHPLFLKRAKEMSPKIICVSTLTADLWPRDRQFNHRLYTDAVVAKADIFVDIIKQELENPPERFIVIENGVDLERFSPFRGDERTKIEITKSLGIAQYSRILVQVGRVHPVKNVEDSLALAQKLCAHRSDCVFLFAGGHKEKDAAYLKDLVDLRERMGLHDRYFFLGERSDIADLLKISDCAISTTKTHEGTPNSILEALAVAKPVVALYCDGISDVVRHGTTGFVAKNVDEAARFVNTILDDETLKERMGDAARKYAVNHFDLRLSVTRYENLYRQLLSEKTNSLKRRWKIRANYLRESVQKRRI